LCQRISDKGCQGCHVEYLHILRTRRARATGETSRKDADHHTIKKPLAQELSHIRCSTWHDHEQADGSSLHFLDRFRRLHLFLGAEGETIFAAWRNPGSAQGVEYFRPIWSLAIVALIDGRDHVN